MAAPARALLSPRLAGVCAAKVSSCGRRTYSAAAAVARKEPVGAAGKARLPGAGAKPRKEEGFWMRDPKTGLLDAGEPPPRRRRRRPPGAAALLQERLVSRRDFFRGSENSVDKFSSHACAHAGVVVAEIQFVMHLTWKESVGRHD
ncbi:hypothetical protein C2845_PM14G15930 [Panicum miliaceum]|uniref:Uncharacterized protein n=1 Tax=Panicum miliaceum TaxID=4540 RepID=A0A3L6PR05_PANMI|nr:hypothetical protein C2845_PM14G15930 [Panicum miliaceum]